MPHDIALIKLAENITMTDYIQPVCVWSKDEGLAQDWLLQNSGIVAGFGRRLLDVY
ncbi:trypsin [Anopheles sinensis]|uniref:Trypsin n=1 Tax=Anopheles sinensis TaxID=74873 RepID=A0A084VWS5_ANOSI|nr:trypsin [Anopheles sinensis]